MVGFNEIINSDSIALKPLDINDSLGMVEWKDGKIDQLVITSENLAVLPESICNLKTDPWNDWSGSQLTNNYFCLKKIKIAGKQTKYINMP